MATHKLTDIQIKKAKPREKLYKLSDGGGLQLWIYPNGAKRWRLAYTFAGKQKTHAIGVYTAAQPVTLDQARAARDAAKAALAEGVEPGAARNAAKAAKAAIEGNTFGSIADEFLEKARRENKADVTLDKIGWLLSFARPALGPRQIAEISAREILDVLRTVEARAGAAILDSSLSGFSA